MKRNVFPQFGAGQCVQSARVTEQVGCVRRPLRECGLIDLIAGYGYSIVLAVAFVDQFGTPIPSIAILLAAGAVAGQGQLNVVGVLTAAWVGTIAGDAIL